MAKTKLPQYVQQRHQTYYFVIEIPKDLRTHYPSTTRGVNKTRIIESLKTRCLDKAGRRAKALAAEWKEEFAKLRGDGDDASFFRQRMLRTKTDQEKSVVMGEIMDKHSDLARASITHQPGYPEPSPAEIKGAEEAALAVADDFADRATGKVMEFDALLTEFLDHPINRHRKAKDRANVTRYVTRFAKAVGTVDKVTDASVQEWIDDLDVAKPTARRMVTSINAYWKYLQRPNVGVVPKSFKPFDDIDYAALEKGGADNLEAWTNAEVLKLLLASQGKPTLTAMILVGMYTGARLSEICDLKCENVHEDYFDITDAKTKAGIRQVPIHDAIKDQVKTWVEESKDGYLIPGIEAKNRFNSRGDVAGSRFYRLKKGMGYGNNKNFHSIRKTVITQLENAKVELNVTQEIVGHKADNITQTIYSAGLSLNIKAEAINKLRYGKPKK